MSLLAPLLGGAFGVIVGAVTTPNATVVIILGVFCALISWAVTGFKTGEDLNANDEFRTPQELTGQEPSKTPEPTIAKLAEPPQAIATALHDARAERQWFWFKVKAALLIGSVLIASNYKRCTETPEERFQRDQYISDRIKSISSQEAYAECMTEGDSESECRESARRVRELANQKANTILGR